MSIPENIMNITYKIPIGKVILNKLNPANINITTIGVDQAFLNFLLAVT